VIWQRGFYQDCFALSEMGIEGAGGGDFISERYARVWSGGDEAAGAMEGDGVAGGNGDGGCTAKGKWGGGGAHGGGHACGGHE
jgi:hypothetical protein